MKVIRRLLRYLTPLHHYIPEYVIYTLLGIVFGLINFGMLIPMVNVLFGTTDAHMSAVPPKAEFSVRYLIDLFNYQFTRISNTQGKLSALIFVCAIVLASNLLANFFRFMAGKVIIRLRLTLMERLRNALYQKLTHQSLRFYHTRNKGSLLSTMTNEVQEIDGTLVMALQVWLKDPFIVLAFFIFLFALSAKLTLFTLVFLPVSGLLIARVTRSLRHMSRENSSLLERILSHIEETISGIRVIQSFAAERYSIDRFASINRDFTLNRRRMARRGEIAAPLSEFLGITVFISVIIYGGYLLTQGDSSFTAAQFITYLAVYSQVISPLKGISNATSNIHRGVVAGEKIFALLDEPVQIEQKEGHVAKKTFTTALTLHQVGFRYQTDNVLHEINLTLPKGKTVALVGESGSGKSTLADLVSRFYDPTEGQITLDGIDLRDINLTDLRSLISFVSQDAVLFNDTIFNNIAFGTLNPDAAAVERAAKIANAHQFIMDSEQGYDTVIGDRGMRLSGGQRQRLTIARAVFKNAPIIVLDEATSALDTESERLVQEALNNMMENRTALVIAHRLSTIQHADEIIVLQKGRIVERGTHKELIQRGGYYFKLVQMQEVR
jgi:ATP-binding cassette, subfamily B, bacterial MsbA